MREPIDLEQLLSESLSSLSGAYSENTIRGYRIDFQQFVRWCEQESRCPLPAQPDTIAAFVEALAETRKPATIRRHLSGIARVHKSLGHPDPIRSDLVKLAVRRMMRKHGRRQRQAGGLSKALQEKLLAMAGDDLSGLRAKAMLSVGYDTLCRRSELIVLRAEDVIVGDDGSGAILIRRSKTDQNGSGRLGYLSPIALEHLNRWQEASGIDEGPLFRRIHRTGKVGSAAMTPEQVNLILKRLAIAAGMDAAVVAKLSGHSMRVGAALDMVENGIDLVPVMHAGGWKSPEMVLRYTQQISLKKSGMAKLQELFANRLASFNR